VVGEIRVALVGNPNTGKSTLFNVLTGLHQKIGNFAGVTVDKKTGLCNLPDGRVAEIIDLPGTYSLYPKSKDETIVFEVLADKNNPSHPDIVVIVADASNLKRNLLLYTQVADLKIPVIIALNMIDLSDKAGTEINIDELSSRLGIQIVPICARKKNNIDKLIEAITYCSATALQSDTIEVEAIAPELIRKIREEFQVDLPYTALHLAHQHENIRFITAKESNRIEELEQEFNFHSQKAQAAETIARYNYINDILFDTVKFRLGAAEEETFSNKIDRVLTHKIWGFVIFFGILFLIFQSIFAWSEYPMTLIENLFVWLATYAHSVLPAGVLTDLFIDGILAGLSGVLVFIPQIAILFAFISILEDTGYMARVTFMMDKIMRKVGLNGKSVVPLIGGLACAVPSIMSTRNIENWKDRMITIMVTPLIACSARLPIYTLLISLVVSNEKVAGVINLQGLVLMGLYVFSMISAIVVAWVMKFLIKSRERGYFIMELPVYRMPRWDNIGITMYQKVRAFVLEAGKVIIAISIILWVLASYGPPAKQRSITQKYESERYNQLSDEEVKRLKASEKLENSYAGVIGKAIEPVIRPLGFDWKIGIALITSFAAREVFVGTMATIYSVNNDASQSESVRTKMSQAVNPDTGKPVFTLAVAFSLMIFYAFAMQCMSTIAVVYRETKSWKWPAIQFAYMTVLAYIGSFIVYNFLK
jgi:ferrous iron transport protein B